MAHHQATPGNASPIQDRIGQVFVPVGDMANADEWYSKILRPPSVEACHGDTIDDLATQGETRLVLDANKPDFDMAGTARFFFWTEDIRVCLDFLRQHNVPIDGQRKEGHES
jgi:hypothetical protein